MQCHPDVYDDWIASCGMVDPRYTYVEVKCLDANLKSYHTAVLLQSEEQEKYQGSKEEKKRNE